MSLRKPKSDIHALGFTQLPGAAVFIAASPDGTFWVLSPNGLPSGDKFIYHYVNGAFVNVPGAATRLAVGPDNTVWALNAAGGIYHLNNGQFIGIGGGASEISIAADNSAYVVSNQPGGPFGRGLYRYANGAWTQLPGAGVSVFASIDSGTYDGGIIAPGGFYVTNSAGSIFYYNLATGFTQLPGAAVSLAPTASGGLFALGDPGAIQHGIYYNDLNVGRWQQMPGAAVGIATAGSNVFALGAAGGIYLSPILPAHPKPPNPTPTPTVPPTPVPTATPIPCTGLSAQRSHAAIQQSPFTSRDPKSGRLIHQFLSRSRFLAHVVHPQGQGSSPNMICHGGPIQTNPKIYLIFWGDSWGDTSPTGGDPNGLQRSALIKFTQALSGSRWLNTTSQYFDPQGNRVGPIAGTATYRLTGTPPAVPTFTDLAIVAAQAATFVGDYSVNANYVVLTPRGVIPDGMIAQGYCAYHSTFGNVAFTNMPYLVNNRDCGANWVNPGAAGSADGVTINFGHEEAETETDPQLSAWYDVTGSTGEIGDKCAWQGLQNNPSAGGFPTQPLWDNTTSSCVQYF